MNATISGSSAVTLAGPTRIRAQPRRFFLGMSLLLALVVFAGFAPSFYLRGYFARPPVSPFIIVHGILFTSWIVLLIAQSALVKAGKPRWHRSLGVVGVALAGAMVTVGVLAQVNHTRRALLNGQYVANKVLEDFFFSQSLLSMVAFAGLVSCAIALRRRGETHKRLLIIATASICTAAIGRLPGTGPIVTPVATLGLLVPLWVYDMLQRSWRPQPATVGGTLVLATLLGIAFTPLAGSAFMLKLMSAATGVPLP
jgi:hypothetical protein